MLQINGVALWGHMPLTLSQPTVWQRMPGDVTSPPGSLSSTRHGGTVSYLQNTQHALPALV